MSLDELIRKLAPLLKGKDGRDGKDGKDGRDGRDGPRVGECTSYPIHFKDDDSISHGYKQLLLLLLVVILSQKKKTCLVLSEIIFCRFVRVIQAIRARQVHQD